MLWGEGENLNDTIEIFFAILSYFLVSAYYLMIYYRLPSYAQDSTSVCKKKKKLKLLALVDSRTEGAILSVYPDDRFGIIWP
jgi:hypothetical protein